MSQATIFATELLERLAVDVDAAPNFDADAAVWLTEFAAPIEGTEALVNIMNDVTESATVRARAMTMLTAELLRH